MLLCGGAVLAFLGDAKNSSWAGTQVRKVELHPGGPKMSPRCSSCHEGGGSSSHTTSLLPGIFLCLQVLSPSVPFPAPPPWGWSCDVCRALQDFPTLTFININTSAEDVIMKTISRSKTRSKAVPISYQWEMGARGLEKLFQSSLKMTMQSDPSQLAANNQHGTTASKAWAQDSKRKYQSFSTQLETIFPAAGEGIFCWGLQGRRKE